MNYLKCEFDNNIPIYIQLVEQLKMDIISSKIKLGERLPSVRDLAIKFKVNPNTMQKALIELENIKLIYTERTNGKYVTNDKKIIEKYKIKYANEIRNNYFVNMKNLGFDEMEAIEYLKEE